jgi:lactoylglutathione lyase
MQLAKPRVDIGLSTNRVQALRSFWEGEAGVAFDHILPIGPGQDQHRFDVAGSVLKINAHADPLPAHPPSGYRELIIARAGLAAPRKLSDPDGNRLSLVPTGFDGVEQIAIRLAVRDLDEHRRFYGEVLGFPEAGAGRFRAGETLLVLEPSPDAQARSEVQGPGWRYITFQVFNVLDEHARVLAKGAREARPPMTLGETARFSMIHDPDGNWIELSQRASIVGSLD